MEEPIVHQKTGFIVETVAEAFWNYATGLSRARGEKFCGTPNG